MYVYVKDLRTVIRNGESLSNAVLVDDDESYCAHDQKSFVHVRMYHSLGSEDYTRLNSVYYMLGIFKTYFENEKYASLPLREALTQILPANNSAPCSAEDDSGTAHHKRWCKNNHTFVNRMMDIGLSAVQEVVTGAIRYTNVPRP